MEDLSGEDRITRLTPTGQLNDGCSDHAPAMSAPGSLPGQDAHPLRVPETVSIDAQAYGRTHLHHGEPGGHAEGSWKHVEEPWGL
jgi:hypothetical protein